MLTAKILEIFASIQGEGIYLGEKQLFVRFFGCNTQCVWCDTPQSGLDGTQKIKDLTVEEVYHKSQPLLKDCHSVSLTGGEPLLHKDFVRALAGRFKQNHQPIFLETNGILYAALGQVIDLIDIISMDFKLPSSTKNKPFWKEHKEFLKLAKNKEVYVKAVISWDTQQEDIEKTVEIIKAVRPKTVLVLQPNISDRSEEAVKKCEVFQSYCLQWLKNVRVIPQVHKILGVR